VGRKAKGLPPDSLVASENTTGSNHAAGNFADSHPTRPPPFFSRRLTMGRPDKPDSMWKSWFTYYLFVMALLGIALSVK
jgi:hypothetical protein